ncbi:MAG: hypothetical protein FWD69_08960 [Polyangiaceae bacterium]|nr:hypothetical protein [Polyangiaceae bacterium]
MTRRSATAEKSFDELTTLTQDPVRGSFVQRSFTAIIDVAKRMQPNELRDAASRSTNLDALVSGLLQPGSIGLLRAIDPLAPAKLRGLRARDELLGGEGGTLTVAEVADLLGITRQAVNKRREARRLLGVEMGRRGFRYPAWQFASGATLAGLEDVLATLGDAPALSKIRFFLSGSHRLGKRRPLDLLRKKSVAPVLVAAKAFGEHGAA